MHVALLVRTMLPGGIARQVAYIASGLRERGHRVSIIQFYARSHWHDQLAGAGVEVQTIGIRGRHDALRLLRGSIRLLRELRPDVLYGFYVESNLLALILGRVTPLRVVWGLRVDNLEALESDAVGRAAAAIHARLLHRPDLVVANSHAGGRVALGHGLPADRLRVIVNGVDTSLFRPDRSDRPRIRAHWGVPEGATLIGTVARTDPRKGHEHVLRAAAVYAHMFTDTHFVLVGPSDEASRGRLGTLVRELGILDRVTWAGVRTDMASVYNALDLTTLLSNRSEGCPNVVAESLACGVPCVVSNVGDSALVVGDPAAVVRNTRDAQAVAAAWNQTLAQWVPERAASARQRMESEFGLARFVDETERALHEA